MAIFLGGMLQDSWGIILAAARRAALPIRLSRTPPASASTWRLRLGGLGFGKLHQAFPGGWLFRDGLGESSSLWPALRRLSLPLRFKPGHHLPGVHAQPDNLEGHPAANRRLLFGHIDRPAATLSDLPRKLQCLASGSSVTRIPLSGWPVASVTRTEPRQPIVSFTTLNTSTLSPALNSCPAAES
jgi:hypothetical protein